jgi:hypothetical protein
MNYKNASGNERGIHTGSIPDFVISSCLTLLQSFGRSAYTALASDPLNKYMPGIISI